MSADNGVRRTRAGVLLWLVAAAYVAFMVWELAGGYAAAARGEAPLYTDYTSLYAASLLVRSEPAENLYRPRRIYEATVATAYVAYGEGISPEQAKKVGYSPWMYPPPFILVSLPLAYLPYLLSFFAWIAVTAVPYVVALRSILRDAMAVPFALAAPPAFFNLAYGQTGFLSGGLIGLGLVLIRHRPLLAGVCIGLASVKPHFGVLIPLALAAGGHWRVFGAAAVTVAGLIVASIAILGIDPWYGFIGTLLFNLEGFQAGAYTWHSMTSVLSTVHMAGLPLDRAWLVQYVVSAGVALVVTWVWWRGRARLDTLGLQSAILCLGAPLAVPMVYLYDLVVVVPGVAWVWLDMRARGAARWQRGLLVASTGAILGVYVIAARLGLQTGALLVGVLFALALCRYHHALRAGSDGGSNARMARTACARTGDERPLPTHGSKRCERRAGSACSFSP